MEENFDINGDIEYKKEKDNRIDFNKEIDRISEESTVFKQLIDIVNDSAEKVKEENNSDDRDLSMYKVIEINDNLPMHPCVLMISVTKKDNENGEIENIGIPGFLEPINCKFYILDSNWKEIEVEGFDESLKKYVSNFSREVILDEKND